MAQVAPISGAHGGKGRDDNGGRVELVVTPTDRYGTGVYEVSIKGKEESGKTYALTTPRSIALEEES